MLARRLILAALLWVVTAGSIINVNCVTSCTFEQIRVAAVGALSGDTVLVTGGPYYGPCTPIQTMAGNGSVTLSGAGVVVDCQGTGPVLNVTNDGADTISGFTFVNASGASVNGDLGALTAVKSSLVLANVNFLFCNTPLVFIGQANTLYSLSILGCTFFNNTALAGPFYYPYYTQIASVSAYYASQFVMRDCVFNGNTLPTYPGNIYGIMNVNSDSSVGTSATMSNVTFLNHVTVPYNGLGGVSINMYDRAYLSGLNYYGNTIGSLLLAVGNIQRGLSLTDSNFIGNTEGLIGVSSNSGGANVTRCVFRGAKTGNYNLVSVAGGSQIVRMQNCTIEDNVVYTAPVMYCTNCAIENTNFARNRVLITPGSYAEAIVVVVQTYGEVTNCSIVNNVGAIPNMMGLVSFRSSYGAVGGIISNTVFDSNVVYQGILGTGGYYLTLLGSTFRNMSYATGVASTGATTVYNTTMIGLQTGITMYTGSTTTVSGSYFKGCYYGVFITSYQPSNYGATGTIMNSTFEGSRSTSVYIYNYDVTLRNLVFKNAIADASPLSIYAYSNYEHNVLATGLVFSNNVVAANGGAIYWSGINTTIDGATFDSNTASGLGGAVYAYLPNANPFSLTVANAQMTNNKASGGGGALALEGAVGVVSLINVDVEYNTGSPSAIYCKNPPLAPMQTSNLFVAHQLAPAISGCATVGLANCSACLFGYCNPSMPNTCTCFPSLSTSFANCTAVPGCGKNGSCDWYVNSVTGSDGNNGTTPVTAFRNLATAMTLAKNGDTIHLAGSFTTFSLSRAVTVMGPATVVCDGQTIALTASATLSTLTLQGCGVNVTGSASLTGLATTGGPSPIRAFAGAQLSIDACHLSASAITIASAANVSVTRSVLDGGSTLVATGATLLLEETAFRDGSQATGTTVSIFGGSFVATATNFTNLVGATAGALRLDNYVLALLTNCLFANNQGTTDGGALAAFGSASVTMTGTTFNANQATSRGGGIYTNAATVYVLTGCTLNGNTAVDGGGIYADNAFVELCAAALRFGRAYGAGGGLFITGGVLIFEGGTVSGNTATFAGGLHVDSLGATLSAVFVTANTASQGSGGARILQSAQLSPMTFTGNVAPDAAALNITGANVNISSSSFTSNTALNGATCGNWSGSAVLVTGANVFLDHVTFTANIGGLGAALRLAATNGGTTVVTSATVTQSTCGSGVHVATGARATLAGVTVTGTAGWGGGVSLDVQSTTNIIDSSIDSNTASSAIVALGSGGVTCWSCAVTMTNTRVTNNSAGAGNIGAGFGCKLLTYAPTASFSNTTFAGNQDASYPGLEADMTACGGCPMRTYAPAALRFNVSTGVTPPMGCVPLAGASCGYTCVSPYYGIQPAMTCQGVALDTPVDQNTGFCRLITTCPLLSSADPNLVISQSNPANNNSVASFSCNPTSGTELRDTQSRVCHPPDWSPLPLPTCVTPPAPPPATPATTSTTDATTGAAAIVSTQPPDNSLTKNLPYIGAGIGLVVLLCLMCIAILAIRRSRKRRPRKFGSSNDETIRANVSMKQIVKDMLANATVIAEGGSGTVYKTRYEGNVVALKIFKENNASAVLDYHREVKAFTAFSQGTVSPAVLDLKFISGEPMAIAMEFIDGVSLYDLIASEGRNLSENRRMDIIEQLVEVLESFESRHLAHLDIKTKNILIQKGNHVKLIDYGLTQVTTERHSVNELTGFTPQYVAPEIASIAHNVQRNTNASILTSPIDLHACDTYSFGVVLWSLCALTEPYPGVPGTDVFVALVNDPHRRPPIPEIAHGHWIDIVKDAWATNPDARPTFAEIAARLQRCRENCFTGPTRRTQPVPLTPRNRASIPKSVPQAIAYDATVMINSQSSFATSNSGSNAAGVNSMSAYATSNNNSGAPLMTTGAMGAGTYNGKPVDPVSHYQAFGSQQPYAEVPVYGSATTFASQT